MSVSEEAISTVMSLMESEFEKCRVMDETVRRNVVISLLTEEDLISEAMGKYDLAELMSGADTVQSVMVEQVGHPIVMYAQLSAEQQAMLVRNNRDVRLIFESGPTLPHALAYSQRIIDTNRCLKYLNKSSGEILDIGGNYAAHKRAARVIHSCTLVDSVREQHRQAERLANLQSEFRVMDCLQYCTEGAENCFHKATQSMSVHAMPAIPWENWPQIMDQHGLSYHYAVFHYDPEILVSKSGKLEGSDMFYRRDSKNINFFFELDSSLDYTHDWDNYQKYLAPWCQVSDSSPYAYVYDIKSVIGGVATAEIVRVMKSSIGRQVLKPYHAYVPRETVVEISTVVYDIDSNLPPDDPAAYIDATIRMDSDMFRFMYMYGVANDTANPNMPMSLPDFRSMFYVFNHTRKFGEICVSARKKVRGIDMHYVVSGMYHHVVRERAMLQVRSQAATTAMLEKQRVQNVSWATIGLMVPVAAVAIPAVMLGRGFSYYCEAISKACRRLISGRGALCEVSKPPSYVRLYGRGFGDMNGYREGQKFSFWRPPVVLENVDKEKLSSSEFAALLQGLGHGSDADSSVGDSSTAVESQLVKTPVSMGKVGLPGNAYVYKFPNVVDVQVEDADVAPDSLDDGREDRVALEVSYADEDEVNMPVRQVYEELFGLYNDAVMSHVTTKKEHVVVPTPSDAHANYKSMLLEYAVYCFDCGNGVLSTLRRDSQYHAPGGKPNRTIMRDTNNAIDSGARLFDVYAGRMQLDAVKYMIGVDPMTQRFHYIHRSPDRRAAYIRDLTVSLLYVDENVRIFNHFLLGKAALATYKKSWTPMCAMSLVDGIPGCLKTTEIVKEFQLTDAIVCPVKDSKTDTLRKLMKCGRFDRDEDQLRARVRTVDSVNCNGFRVNGQVRVLFVDEGLMAFPGQLYAVMDRIRPFEVRVYGDSLQITAIDRSPSLGVLMHTGLWLWTSIENRNVSHTMPADVTVLLKKFFYKRDIWTTSPVRRSLAFNHRPSVEDMCYTSADNRFDYLSVLVGDKAKLLSNHGYVDGKKIMHLESESSSNEDLAGGQARVYTVHEAQGQRLKRSHIVRMNPQTCDVLESKRHILVAISRHWYQCVYSSVAASDPLVQLLKQQITDEELDEVMKPSEQWQKDLIQKISAK